MSEAYAAKHCTPSRRIVNSMIGYNGGNGTSNSYTQRGKRIAVADLMKCDVGGCLDAAVCPKPHQLARRLSFGLNPVHVLTNTEVNGACESHT